MKKFVLTLVCAAVVLPFIVGCGSKKEEVISTPIEGTSTTSEEMNTESAPEASSEESDSKEDYTA